MRAARRRSYVSTVIVIKEYHDTLSLVHIDFVRPQSKDRHPSAALTQRMSLVEGPNTQ